VREHQKKYIHLYSADSKEHGYNLTMEDIL